MAGHCENGNEISGFMRGKEFLVLQICGQVLNVSFL